MDRLNPITPGHNPGVIDIAPDNYSYDNHDYLTAAKFYTTKLVSTLQNYKTEHSNWKLFLLDRAWKTHEQNTPAGEIIVTVDNKPFAVIISLGEENVEDVLLMVSRLRAQRAARSIRSQERRAGLDKMTLKDIQLQKVNHQYGPSQNHCLLIFDSVKAAIYCKVWSIIFRSIN